jgi:hypothetical protein
MTEADFRGWVQLIVLIAYGYQLCVWPVLFWLMTLATLSTGVQWPAPVVVPWEHLIAGTVTLASLGGMEAVKARFGASRAA